MISINKINGKVNSSRILTIYGLSTDEKPIDMYRNFAIGNSSIFVEMDTDTQYLYDEENRKWIERQIASGDASIESITSEELAAMWGDD